MIFKKSIFMKLFLTYLLILFLSFTVFSFVSYLLIENRLTESHRHELSEQAKTVAEFIQHAHEQGWEHQVIIESLEMSIARQDKAFYLMGQNEEVLYHAGQPPVSITLDHEVLQSAFQGKHIIQKVKLKELNQYALLAATPIVHAETEKVLVMISYGFEKEILQRKLNFLLGLVITILITAASLFFISKRLTSSLTDMSKIALSFAKGNFNQRVHIDSKDEIGQLGMSLNYMAKELASLDQMRKDFVANVSHDLRSPLTSIHGFAEALIDGTIPKQRQDHYLSIIKNETNRLIKLVNDLLDISKLESGHFGLQPIPFNFSEQVRRVIAKMEPYLADRQVEIGLITDEEADVDVYADPDRIEQVLVNLLQNAINFSHAGGQIDVILTKAERASLEIRDYGMGIKEEDIQFIWDRFYKVDKARSKKLGTGIGLSIVKQILEKHESPIEVESELGKGTSFRFTLPLAK